MRPDVNRAALELLVSIAPAGYRHQTCPYVHSKHCKATLIRVARPAETRGSWFVAPVSWQTLIGVSIGVIHILQWMAA